MSKSMDLRDVLKLMPDKEDGVGYTINESGEITITGKIYIDDRYLLNGYNSITIGDCIVSNSGVLSIIGIPILKIKNLVSNTFWTEGVKLYKAGLTSLKGIRQISGGIDLSYNNITSLEGFEMNGELDLDHNKITSLTGFIHSPKDTLRVENNKITSLEGYVCEGEIWLEGNPIPLNEFKYWGGYSNSSGMFLNLPTGEDNLPLMPTLEANSIVRVALNNIKSLKGKVNLIF